MPWATPAQTPHPPKLSHHRSSVHGHGWAPALEPHSPAQPWGPVFTFILISCQEAMGSKP